MLNIGEKFVARLLAKKSALQDLAERLGTELRAKDPLEVQTLLS
jgi:hypothetical protein